MNDILLTPIRLNELETLIENSVRKVLGEIPQGSNNQPDTDQLLTVSQTSTLLGLQPCTIYGLVHKATIPVNKKGKRLYFSKQELTDWIKAGRRKTVSEIATDAEQYVSDKKKGGKR